MSTNPKQYVQFPFWYYTWGNYIKKLHSIVKVIKLKFDALFLSTVPCLSFIVFHLNDGCAFFCLFGGCPAVLRFTVCSAPRDHHIQAFRTISVRLCTKSTRCKERKFHTGCIFSHPTVDMLEHSKYWAVSSPLCIPSLHQTIVTLYTSVKSISKAMFSLGESPS